MKDFYLRDCAEQENKVITSQFVVVSKQIKAKKNGEPYLSLTLGDRTGSIDAKMWDNVEEFLNAFEQDDFVKIKGLINKYNSRWQLTIHKIRRLGDSEMQLRRLPAQDDQRYRRALANAGRTIVDELAEPAAQTAAATVHGRRSDRQAYKCAPAAKTLHHAFIGGLARPRCLAVWQLRPDLCATIRWSIATCCSPASSCTTSARSTS